MGDLSQTSVTAIILLLSGDSEIWEIISLSFGVSLSAILIATPPALIIAFLLAFYQFRFRRALISLFNTFMSIPAVIIGLTLYLMLSRSGPLGDLKLLFTQEAMVIGQIMLSFPLLTAMGHAAFQSADRRAWETAITLGAKPWRAFFTLMFEVRFGLIAAVVAGFGRVIAEIGSSMMVGGNILHATRNIPTAIALETSKGEFTQGIALGIVLLVLSLCLNAGISIFQGKGDLHT
ncbi:MAG: ABC transporter permease [Cycloclasticus sp. symbiont of Poecilosclerida sp. M]|nr:MAG: ABC transporter permease [Cycloclasticus sp. symbiont of Poecilosclerida sp. M]